MALDLLAHIEINEPLMHFDYKKKKDRKGEYYRDKYNRPIADQRFYLSKNLLYSGPHFMVIRMITNHCKDWILPFLVTIPKMEKCQLHFIYHHPNPRFDLDNKLGFWHKIIQDLFKTPSTKEQIKARDYNYTIRSINVLDDDSTYYIDAYKHQFVRGQHKLEIRVYGIIKNEQKKLFS